MGYNSDLTIRNMCSCFFSNKIVFTFSFENQMTHHHCIFVEENIHLMPTSLTQNVVYFYVWKSLICLGSCLCPSISNQWVHCLVSKALSWHGWTCCLCSWKCWMLGHAALAAGNFITMNWISHCGHFAIIHWAITLTLHTPYTDNSL